MLILENFSCGYGPFRAVHSLNLKIKEGSVNALIGPNGAGKTTFFNLLTGHLQPTSGQVLYKGHSLRQLAPHNIVRLGLARSFQLINIYPRMTVFQNIQVAVIARNKKHFSFFKSANSLFQRESEELLELVTLVEEREVIAGELAYGKQKQLELAISLASNPEVLLLDEPTAGMSTSETNEAISLIKEISSARSLTLLFTEHDMGVVFGIADQISVLHHGKIVATGSPEKVRNNTTVKNIYLGDGETDGQS